MKVICVVLALFAAAQAGYINGGHGIGHGVEVGHGLAYSGLGYSGLGYSGLGYGGVGYGGVGYGGLGYSGLGYSGLGLHGGHAAYAPVHSAYHVAPVHHQVAYAAPAVHYSAPVHYDVGHTKVIGVGHGVHGYNAGWLKKK